MPAWILPGIPPIEYGVVHAGIFVNVGMGNTPLLEYDIVHAGIYW